MQKKGDGLGWGSSADNNENPSNGWSNGPGARKVERVRVGDRRVGVHRTKDFESSCRP
jgi:hypothetical protein